MSLALPSPSAQLPSPHATIPPDCRCCTSFFYLFCRHLLPPPPPLPHPLASSCKFPKCCRYGPGVGVGAKARLQTSLLRRRKMLTAPTSRVTCAHSCYRPHHPHTPHRPFFRRSAPSSRRALQRPPSILTLDGSWLRWNGIAFFFASHPDLCRCRCIGCQGVCCGICTYVRHHLSSLRARATFHPCSRIHPPISHSIRFQRHFACAHSPTLLRSPLPAALLATAHPLAWSCASPP